MFSIVFYEAWRIHILFSSCFLCLYHSTSPLLVRSHVGLQIPFKNQSTFWKMPNMKTCLACDYRCTTVGCRLPIMSICPTGTPAKLEECYETFLTMTHSEKNILLWNLVHTRFDNKEIPFILTTSDTPCCVLFINMLWWWWLTKSILWATCGL